MIDKNRLTRDYETYERKKGEILPKEDIEYLYLEVNLSAKDVYTYLGIKVDTFRKWLKFYGIKKSRKLIVAQSNRDHFLKYGCSVSARKDVKEAKKKTSLEKYGVEYAAQLPEYRQKLSEAIRKAYPNSIAKRKKTCLERYGTEFAASSSIIKDQIRQTNIERYGAPSASCNQEIKQKIKDAWKTKTEEEINDITERRKETCLEKYGVDNYFKKDDIQEIIKAASLEKYGTEWPSQSSEIREKIKKTNLEKYGVECNFEIDYEKRQQTWLEKYGVDNPSKIPEVQEKRKQLSLQAYGYEHPAQRPEVKEKLSKIQADIWKNKTEEEIKEIMHKSYLTKKNNHSLASSKPEERCLKLLKQKYEVIHHYREKRYPYNCDFYLPQLDLFIELHATWTHGPFPYINNNECNIILDKWKKKALSSDYYKEAIYTWTDLDVRKREVAEKNNLNYLVFYYEEDFNTWLENEEKL